MNNRDKGEFYIQYSRKLIQAFSHAPNGDFGPTNDASMNFHSWTGTINLILVLCLLVDKRAAWLMAKQFVIEKRDGFWVLPYHLFGTTIASPQSQGR